jgi:serine/threonine protein kinase
VDRLQRGRCRSLWRLPSPADCRCPDAAPGIIHRDLKPANIKITLDGAAKALPDREGDRRWIDIRPHAIARMTVVGARSPARHPSLHEPRAGARPGSTSGPMCGPSGACSTNCSQAESIQGSDGRGRSPPSSSVSRRGRVAGNHAGGGSAVAERCLEGSQATVNDIGDATRPRRCDRDVVENSAACVGVRRAS